MPFRKSSKVKPSTATVAVTTAADERRIRCDLHKFAHHYIPPSYLPSPPSQCQFPNKNNNDNNINNNNDASNYNNSNYNYAKHSSILKTVFVLSTTLSTTTLFLLIVFLWLLNRQFHLLKKKHSYDKHPLEPLRPLRHGRVLAKKSIQKAKKRIQKGGKRIKGRLKNLKNKRRNESFDEGENEEAALSSMQLLLKEANDKKAKELREKQESELLLKRHKSMQSFLEDVEEEDEEIDHDDDDDDEKGGKVDNTKTSHHYGKDLDVMETVKEIKKEASSGSPSSSVSSLPTNKGNNMKRNIIFPNAKPTSTITTTSSTSSKSSTTTKKGTAKDLLHLASKIEVFSYLSPEALVYILDYVEYLDYVDVGEVIFDGDTLDGSMYAVVSGEVTMSLSIDNNGDIGCSSGSGSGGNSGGDDDKDNDGSPCFSFVAGPGEVITSMLTIITSLIREYQLQEETSSTSTNTNSNTKSKTQPPQVVIPQGINVRAVVTAANTRLLRIPSQCFVAILEKFPSDVHMICQTIVARLQRVTIQTLVRFLGLDAGILGISGGSSTSRSGCSGGKGKGGGTRKVPEKVHKKSAEWDNFEQSLKGLKLDGSNKCDGGTQSLLDRALSAAACQLGFPPGKGHLLQEGASIMYASKGHVICETGKLPNSIYLILNGSLEVGLDKKSKKVDNSNDDASPLLSSSSPPSSSFLLEQREEERKAKRTKMILSSATSKSRPPMEKDRDSNTKVLFHAGPGTFVGLFSCFTNDASLITVRNPIDSKSENTVLLKISSKTFENVVNKYPRALIYCLLDIIDTIGDGANLCVSPPMYLLDWTLDWMHVEAGENIAIRGEPCDSMFVVINGRLRAGQKENLNSKVNSDKKQSEQEEFGRGATIGELEALSEGNWSQSVYAVRHSELARVPMSLMNILMEMFPSAGIHFAKVVASRVQSRSKSLPSLLPSYNLSLATIAVVPLTAEVDVSEFCLSLSASLSPIAPTKLLNKTEIKSRVGKELFKHRNTLLKVKMTRIIGDMEENDRLVVYEADLKYTWWTKLCIQQADCVLLLVDSRNAPDAKRVEDILAWAHDFKNVRIELVVIQSSLAQEMSKAGEHASDNLNNWSENRAWISKQHLCRMPFAEHVKDIQRMCRRVTGQSVGLVLGGGGARGLAHLGIIKALNEAGIPVDIVGGTSQGAFIGALLARNPDDFDELLKSLHQMASNMASVKEKLLDLTFPITSFFSGERFNRGIHQCLGDIRIQDLVLNFFCVSVDLRNSRQVVHTKGLAWKYVRASMSLSGYLPPVAENKSLLVDGGYMNVVPADVMAEFGAKTIIAVDVANENVADYYEYGTSLSGLWVLYNSWNPFVQTVKVPSMGDINEMLSWVSAERLRKKMISQVDLFLKPPVQDYGTLEFDKFDEIVAVGYDYAKPIIDKWAEKNGFQANL